MNKQQTTKKLLLVESPAKIKTISKFLGPDFVIMSTYGHIKDLPQNKLGVTINDNETIDLQYTALSGKAEVISNICKKARTCDEVYLASDPDREGEIISWHIGQEVEKVIKKNASIHRIVFNEITKPAIEQAIHDKREINNNKVYAQQARRVLDRWVGYEVSPILWRKITKGLSAGRVQSVALLLVCKREEEINSFKQEEYWSVSALFTLNNETFTAELYKIGTKKPALKNKDEVDKLLAQIRTIPFSIASLTEKKRLKNALPPFMTSSLQQDAYNKLGFSVDKTMKIAQKLYEGIPLADKSQPEALITYMRTDSLRISDTALSATREFIKKEYGKEYSLTKAKQYGAKGATQDAHEAIRPIDISRTPEQIKKYLTPDQAKLYDLIWKRFVACQMAPAEYFQRTVLLTGETYTFKATGSSLMFDGFLKVYAPAEEEEKDVSTQLPRNIEKGASVSTQSMEGKQHFTKPPARYSQATLVKELEKEDVGRPSTYATILSTIEKRNYVTIENKRFVPTELGKSVNELLTTNLPDIINVAFTANMEKSLDKIAQGEVERDAVLISFYKAFMKEVKKFGETTTRKKSVETSLTCPTCKKPLLVRFSSNGEFLGCSGYPECTYTANFKREEDGSLVIITPEEQASTTSASMKCPKCGKEMVQKRGKYGTFIACSGYPECKHIHQEKLSMPCPECKSTLVKRAWRGGQFWGCSKYPQCKFAIFGQVEERPCSVCKDTTYVLVSYNKSKEKFYLCPNKTCNHKERAEQDSSQS